LLILGKFYGFGPSVCVPGCGSQSVLIVHAPHLSWFAAFRHGDTRRAGLAARLLCWRILGSLRRHLRGARQNHDTEQEKKQSRKSGPHCEVVSVHDFLSLWSKARPYRGRTSSLKNKLAATE
jgi:hypothetical protein